MSKTLFSYKEIMKGVFKDGDGEEIPGEFYCEKCGCLLATLDTSYKLEEFFSTPGKGHVLIDVCDCQGSIV